MLFLKNLLLRNFQGCCLLFNYQGSSLFLLIRSSSDILSRRFSLVKNFFHFVQRSALASCPAVALGLVLFIGLSQRQVVSYHGKSELSMFFLFFIFFAQFRQFTLFTRILSKTKQQLCQTLKFVRIICSLYHWNSLF